MIKPAKKFISGIVLAILTISIAACSSGKKVTPVKQESVRIAPALSPAERVIQFVDTGEPYLLYGIFNDSVLDRMSINEMVSTRNDFIRSFGKLLRAEGPNFDSDTSATVILYHEDMILAANLFFDKNGLIRDLKILQDIDNEQLGSF